MNECKWQDGEFEPCLAIKDQGAIWNNNGLQCVNGIDVNIFYCPFCGADVRKPEPEQPSHPEIRKNLIDSIVCFDGGSITDIENTLIDAVLFLLRESREAI